MVDCLLCLQTEQEIKECIQVDSTQWTENDIKQLIDKHLWPLETIKENAWLCGICWETIKEFHKFYNRIEYAHNDLKSLLKSESEDKKPTNLQLEILLEPEIIIGQTLDTSIVIKEEKEDAPVIETIFATDDYSDALSGPALEANPILANEKNENSDDDWNLEHAMKRKKVSHHNSIAVKTQILSKNIDEEHKTDNDNSDSSDSDPLQSIKVSQIKRSESLISYTNNSNTSKNKSGYVPRTNRIEQDKFLQEHFKITCNKCNIPFDTFPQLCKHYNTEHMERGFVTCCETKFYDRKNLVHHIQYHLDPEYFKCKLCGKVLTSQRGLQIHLETHKEKSLKCDNCDKMFRDKYKLENHKRVHLSKEEKKHPCNECGKFFASESILVIHQRVVHLGVYAKVCDLCGATMPDTSSFKNHMKRHEENCFQIPCKECGLLLAGPLQLQRHMDIRHPADGNREHKCHICPKISPSLRALKKHIRYVHETDYDFKCTICDKAFKRADNLKTHMNIHTGTHRYRCQWCDQTFNSDGNMYMHRKRAHPEEWEEARRQKYCGNLPESSDTNVSDTFFPEKDSSEKSRK